MPMKQIMTKYYLQVFFKGIKLFTLRSLLEMANNQKTHQGMGTRQHNVINGSLTNYKKEFRALRELLNLTKLYMIMYANLKLKSAHNFQCL